MSISYKCRNKYENLYVKKRNRKKSARKRVRQWRKVHGRSTNSLKRPSKDSSMRQKRMIQMKYNKNMCHHLTNDALDCTTDNMASIPYNPIPIWTCHNCNYTNIERGTNCKVCDSIYTYTHSQSSHEITLGQFFEDESRLLSIPVWVCTQCTYRNIERLSLCQICESPFEYHSFSKRQKKLKKRKQNKQSKSTETHLQTTEWNFWNCPQCTLINSNDAKTCMLCDYKKPSNNVSHSTSVKQEYDITVQLKLNTNCWFNSVKTSKLNAYTDITYYGLSECNLTVKNTDRDDSMSYVMLPSTVCRSSQYKCASNVIVPIGGNNKPLKSVAALAWASNFNRFNTLKPKWNEPEIGELSTLNFCHSVLEILMGFIPSYDICKTVLFDYIQIFMYVLEKNDISDGCFVKYKQKNADGNSEWCDAKIIKHKNRIKVPKYSEDEHRRAMKELNNGEEVMSIKIERKTWWGHKLPSKWVHFSINMICFCEDECENNMHIIKDYRRRLSFYCDMSRKYCVSIDGSILLNEENLLDIRNKYDNKIKVFMDENNGKIPFRLCDAKKLSTIRERYYDNFRCFEIGFNKHDI